MAIKFRLGPIDVKQLATVTHAKPRSNQHAVAVITAGAPSHAHKRKGSKTRLAANFTSLPTLSTTKTAGSDGLVYLITALSFGSGAVSIRSVASPLSSSEGMRLDWVFGVWGNPVRCEYSIGAPWAK